MFPKFTLLSIPEQIARSFEQLIQDGNLKPGEAIPSQLVLADYFGVSRPTIREALELLKTKKVIEPIPQKTGGYKICEHIPQLVGRNQFKLINHG